VEKGTKSKSSAACPVAVGALHPNSTVGEARAAANKDGFNIPSSYVGEPAKGNGWVFREPGTTGDPNTIRVMEPNSSSPNGYVRVYNSYGIPNDFSREPLGNVGVVKPETHFELSPDVPPIP
jgi:NAD(P)H-dependent flavin oxidoreductase YrpB (nitropropane dioxygenase family)